MKRKRKKERVWREWEEKNTIFCFGLIKKCELFNAPIKMGINCVANVSITQSAEQIVPQRRCCQREADRPNQKERESGEEWEYRERERDAVVERVSRVSVLEKQNTFTAHKLPRSLAHYLSLTLYLSHSISLSRWQRICWFNQSKLTLGVKFIKMEIFRLLRYCFCLRVVASGRWHLLRVAKQAAISKS